jgi:putative ABC transport system permease protein
MRSVLTILMVAIGATLIISLNGMSAGMSVFINEQFSSLAPNILIITPAPLIQTGGTQSNPMDLDYRVVNSIEQISGIEEVIPIVTRMVTLKSGSSTTNLMAMGLDQIEGRAYIMPSLELEEGNLVSPYDSVGALIGQDVKYPAGQTTPLVKLGQTVTLEYNYVEVQGEQQKLVTEKRSFVVRGVAKELGTGAAFNIDNVVMISLSAANSFFKSGGKYDMIMVATEDSSLNDQVETAIIDKYGEDLGVTSPKTLTETIQGFLSGFSIFVLGVAAVSLIVAAVGVVTTLFTSILERTREIGLLKALGFKNHSIMMLFLSEATMIGIIGATLGLILGMIAGGSLLGGLVSAGFGGVGEFNLSPVFLPRDLIFVWLFSVAISSIAGFYPSWRASRLDPVVALRKE